MNAAGYIFLLLIAIVMIGFGMAGSILFGIPGAIIGPFVPVIIFLLVSFFLELNDID